MSDLIRKKDAVTAISDLLMIQLQGKALPTWNEVYHAIDDIPSVEPERTAKATEVKTDDDVYDIKGVHTWCKEYRCEKCGFIQFAIEDHGRYTYCPNCGARLELK